MADLTFAQLEALWIQAGGSKQAAPVAAAIALAESRGNPNALNNNPATGDYSVGLWQINYYGNLAPARTAEFGTPAQVANPLANAKAAVALSGGGANFTPWTTYTSGAYQANMPGGSAGVSLGTTPAYSRGARPSGSGGGVLGGLESIGGDLLGAGESVALGPLGILGSISGIFGDAIGGIGDVKDALKVILWLFSPVHWLMAFEILVGTLLMILGLFFLGQEAAGIEGRDDIGSAKDVASTIGLGALIPVAGEAKVAKAASGARRARQTRREASRRPKSRIADRTPGDQRRAGFTLDVDKPRRKTSPGAGPGDEIPF